MTGSKSMRIFPETANGQKMRWSKFKDKDPREIFDILSQRIFSAIKNMKYGRLPDFSDMGELIEIEDNEHSMDEDRTSFSKYMEDAMTSEQWERYSSKALQALIQIEKCFVYQP